MFPRRPREAEADVRYLADLLADSREELTRADSKASLLLAAVGVVVSALIAGLVGGRWSPLGLGADIQWLWWLGTAAAALGVLLIAAAVYPRVYQPKARHPGLPTYYADVAACRNVEAFRRAVKDSPRSRDRLVYQVFVTSSIVQRKYVLIRHGLWCLLLAIAACTLAAVLGTLLAG